MEFLSEIINREEFVIEYGSHIRDAIMIVLEGEFTFSVQGKQYRATKNSICVFPKDTLFERRVIQKIKCIYFQFDKFPVHLHSGILYTSDPKRTENTISHLVREVEDKNSCLIEHFLMDILYLHSRPEFEPMADDPIVSKCISFFSRHFREHITLETLSQNFSVSKQCLIRKFKKHTGKTPMEYLNFVRINESKLLLRFDTMPISDIAEKCGFENVYYFSNRFKQIVGDSPSVYRKQSV